MNTEGKLNQLKTLLNEVIDLKHVRYLLGWDQQTYMPPGGAQDRGHHKATIRRLEHIKYTWDEIVTLLEDLKPHLEEFDPDSDESRLIQVAARQVEKRRKVPPKL